jgi:hypothetical protein
LNALTETEQRIAVHRTTEHAHDHPRRVAALVRRARTVRSWAKPSDRSSPSAIAQTGVSTGRQAVALAVFIAIASLGPGLPVAIYFALGARTRVVLADLERWMGAHNAAIMVVLCLVIAAKLIGEGITGLS